MNTKTVAMRKILPLANGLVLFLTIAINYLSFTGIFQGHTIAAESARYPSLFTPASWAFNIWALIYLALLAFVIYQGRALKGDKEAEQLVTAIGGWFLLSCLANCLWIIAWVYDHVSISVLIILILCFSLWKIIQRTDMELTDPPLRTIAFVWWPFCLYSGWISVALFANIGAWLVKHQLDTPTSTTWTIVMIILVGALHLLATWKRNMREFGFVGVWALIAIAAANSDRAPDVTITAYSIAAILFLSSSIHAYINRATSPFRRRQPGDAP